MRQRAGEVSEMFIKSEKTQELDVAHEDNEANDVPLYFVVVPEQGKAGVLFCNGGRKAISTLVNIHVLLSTSSPRSVFLSI